MHVRCLVVLAFQAVSAYACGCTAPTVDQARSGAEVVFRGTITALRDSDRSPGIGQLARDTGKIAVFTVSRVWKGEVGPAFEMPAVEETSACIGFVPSFLKVGNDLLVYAKRFPGSSEFYTNICTRTALAKDAKDFDELGLGEEPGLATSKPQEGQPGAPPVPTADNHPSNLPDGRTLFRKYHEITNDYSAAQTLKLVGELSLRNPPVRGSLIIYQDIAGRSYVAINLPPLGKFESGFDGTVAWNRTPIGPAQILAKEDVRLTIFGLSPDDVKNWNTRFTVETIGEDTVDGQLCYLVRMTPRAAGRPTTACLDDASGLMVKLIWTVHTQEGEMPTTQIMRDYRDEGGIKVAHQIETTASGMPMLVDLTEIKINVELPSHVFDLPDDIRVLVDAQQGKNDKSK